MIQADRIIKEMMVTEKATELTSHNNQYTFKVHPDANRIMVKQAIESAFKDRNITVTNVNILNMKPKAKRDRARRGRTGFKAGYKKAIVTLKDGDVIDLV